MSGRTRIATSHGGETGEDIKSMHSLLVHWTDEAFFADSKENLGPFQENRLPAHSGPSEGATLWG